jgi:hypothetical protein
MKGNNMKLWKTILAILLILQAGVFAYDDEPYNENGDPNYRYESNTGTKYQYDLSDPMDRIEYSTDVDAQFRDKMNINPMVDMDRDMGQFGGGVEEW